MTVRATRTILGSTCSAVTQQEIPPPAVARYSPWLVGWFQWYIRGYLRKHFHAVAICEDSLPEIDAGERLVVYLNHASWWDPLVAMYLADQLLPERKVIAPFEAEAMAKYPFFERLGFFGVDKTSRRGAVDFLRTAIAAVDQPATSLWLTPEGRFCDPRDRSAEFEPGLAHLAAKLAASTAAGERPAVLAPLAIEYPFWEERLPEVLVRFGEPLRVADYPGYDKEAWRPLLEQQLRTAQAALEQVSTGRQTDALRILIGGKAGVGGVYELVRRLKSKLTGKSYQASHGEKLRT